MADIADFDLGLLVYGIDLKISEKSIIKRKSKIAQTLGAFISSVRYIKANNLFIVNEKIVADARYLYGNNNDIKVSTEKISKWVMNVWGDSYVTLDRIKNKKTLVTVFDEIRLLVRYQKFTSSFMSVMHFNNFNKNKSTVPANFNFEDESDLEDYIFYILNTENITEFKVISGMPMNDPLTTIISNFTKLGWVRNSNSGSSTTPKGADQIFLVLEKNNWRLFHTRMHSSPYYFDIGLVHSSDKIYNYIDEGRSFLNIKQYDYNKPLNDLYYNLSSDEIKELTEYVVGNKFEVITKSFIDTCVNGAIKRKAYEANVATLSDILRKKVEYKLQALKSGKETFKLNEIEYTQTSIEYGGQILTLNNPLQAIPDNLKYVGFSILDSFYTEISKYKSVGGFRSYGYTCNYRRTIDFLNSKPVEVGSINNITFDVIYDEFMGMLGFFYLNKLLNKSTDLPISIKVGGVDVNISVTKNITSNSSTVYYYFINNIKITKDDLFYCVYEAISYETTKKYDEFLKSVSYTSLKVHKLTKTGLVLDFFDNVLEKQIKLSIPVIRVKNKNYLMINKVPRRIKNTPVILTLSKKNSILDIIKTMIKEDVVDNVEYTDLKNFVTEGQKVYNELIEKRNKLIQDSLKSLNIDKVDTVILPTGASLTNVYLVKGKLREYYIEQKEPFRIFSAQEGRYICMLDKVPYMSPEVKLVNRLYALKNDSVISKDIATLEF